MSRHLDEVTAIYRDGRILRQETPAWAGLVLLCLVVVGCYVLIVKVQGLQWIMPENAQAFWQAMGAPWQGGLGWRQQARSTVVHRLSEMLMGVVLWLPLGACLRLLARRVTQHWMGQVLVPLLCVGMLAYATEMLKALQGAGELRPGLQPVVVSVLGGMAGCVLAPQLEIAGWAAGRWWRELCNPVHSMLHRVSLTLSRSTLLMLMLALLMLVLAVPGWEGSWEQSSTQAANVSAEGSALAAGGRTWTPRMERWPLWLRWGHPAVAIAIMTLGTYTLAEQHGRKLRWAVLVLAVAVVVAEGLTTTGRVAPSDAVVPVLWMLRLALVALAAVLVLRVHELRQRTHALAAPGETSSRVTFMNT